MDKTIKNLQGIATIALFAVIAVSVPSYAWHYGKAQMPASSLGVSGEGRVNAVPDIAQFSFSVISSAGTEIGNLEQKNTEKINALIDFLKQNGVKEEDIRTEQFMLEPQYQYYNCPMPEGKEPIPCPPSTIAGYNFTQTVSVKVRDFSKLSAIASGVVQKGATQVSNFQFRIEDLEKVYAKAREDALKKAQEKALSIATLSGVRLGRLISVDEWTSGPPMPYDQYGYGGGAPGLAYAKPAIAGPEQVVPAEPFFAPVIAPGSQEVLLTVNARYEIL